MKKWHWSTLFYSIECLYLFVLMLGVVQLIHPGFAEPFHSLYSLLPNVSAAVMVLLATPTGRALQDPAFWRLILVQQWLVVFIFYTVFVVLISPALSLVRRQRPNAVCLAPLYWLVIGSFIYAVPQWLSPSFGVPVMVLSLILNATLLFFSARRLRRSVQQRRSQLNVLGCGAAHVAALADGMQTAHASLADAANPAQRAIPGDGEVSAAVSDSESSADADETISLTREKLVQE